MTAHLVAFPAFSTFQPETRRSIIEAFAARYGRLVGAVAGLTILLGILRGIAGGVLNVLGSPYGLTWTAAIVLGLGIAAFEGLRISPIVARTEGVSYCGWWTTKLPGRGGEMIRAGPLVPGPNWSCGPAVLPCPGGVTWSH